MVHLIRMVKNHKPKPHDSDTSVLVERGKATFRPHCRGHLLNVIRQNKVCVYHACNSICLAGMRDQSLSVLWIGQGLSFEPGKCPQLYTLYSTHWILDPWSSPCGFQPERWDTDITASYNSLPRDSHLGCLPHQIFSPTACSLCDILETLNKSPLLLMFPTPEPPLAYSCKEHSDPPTSLPQARGSATNIQPSTSQLCSLSSPNCLPSQMAAACLDQL